MGNQGVIHVLAFGRAAEVLGWSSRDVPIDPGQTVADIVQRLEQEYPRLAEGRDRLRFAVNQCYASPDTTLQPGDELAIIPPVAGGEEPPAPPTPVVVRLVRKPIDVAVLQTEASTPQAGAIVTFAGTVRTERDAAGRPLVALEYTAYEAMALREIEAIAHEARERHGVHAVRVVHRLGPLEPGEASVALVVSSAHRAEAFEACREIIEQLKARAPIFKRQHWAGGPPSWVG